MQSLPLLPFSTHNRTIRLAVEADLPAIMALISAARGTMRASGNRNQWVNGYPTKEVILNDMQHNGGHVVEEDGEVIGYFAFLPSPEPTYRHIYDGAWLDEQRPYHVVHRIAGRPDKHGLLQTMASFWFRADANIRIDTHRDNIIMKHCLAKLGFTYCGIIYLESGDERLAYQKINNL